MQKTDESDFPLSTKRSVKGYRHLIREKILEILYASEVGEIEWESVFPHVFFRVFNFGEDIPVEEDDGKKKVTIHSENEKILTQDEIKEIESDISIVWKDEDIDFAKSLIKSYFELKPYLNPLIEEIADNWKLERIARIDRLLLSMAGVEFIKFADIPVKVSINEVIDIAKDYSTEKSGHFINGLLESLLQKLIEQNKVHKSERGLKG